MSEVNTINTHIAEALADLVQGEDSLRMLRNTLILPGTGIEGKYLREAVDDPLKLIDRILGSRVQQLQQSNEEGVSERIAQLWERYFVKDGLLNKDTIQILENACKLPQLGLGLKLKTRVGRELEKRLNDPTIETEMHASPEEVSDYLIERAELCARTRGTGRKISTPLHTTHSLNGGQLVQRPLTWPKSNLIVSVDRDYFIPKESELIDVFLQQTLRELVMNCRDQFAKKHIVEQKLKKVGDRYEITQQGGTYLVGFDPCVIYVMARRNNGTYEFVVADNGKGFTSETLDRIHGKAKLYMDLGDAATSAEEIMIRQQMRPDVLDEDKKGGTFGLPNIICYVEEKFGGTVELGNGYKGARHQGEPLPLPGAFVRLLVPTEVLANLDEVMMNGSYKSFKTQVLGPGNIDDKPATITEWFD